MHGNHVALDRSSGESLIETKWIGSGGEGEEGEKTTKKEEEAPSKAKKGRKKIRGESLHLSVPSVS